MNANARSGWRAGPLVAGGCWAAACVVAMAAMARHQLTPGAGADLSPAAEAVAAEAAAQGPTGSAGASVPSPAAGRPTLVVVLDPRCPCGAATVNGLARMMARCGGRLAGRVLLAGPADPTADAEAGGVAPWRAAEAIPGVAVVRGDGRAAARRLGARTSGQAYLYDPAGRLLFAGGITPARGQAGECPGADAVVERVLAAGGGPPAAPVVASAPVYGCPIEP